MDAHPLKILLIDADLTRAQATVALLQSAGLHVRIEPQAQEAVDRVRSEDFKLLLTQWPPPDMSGEELCRKAHEVVAVPLVGIADEDARSEVAIALETGADDCVAAPLGARELVARIRVAVRHGGRNGARQENKLKVGALTLDARSHQVQIDGREPALTQYEFGLLKALAEEAGRVLSREELMERVKGSLDASFDRSIDVHMCRLRSKLGDDSRQQRILKTVRGAGHMLIQPAQQ